MSQSPKDAFKAEGQSAGEFFSRNGEYFYVPAYQRDYEWKATDHIARLFVDVTEGISQLAEVRPLDALIFIGALILVEDRKKEQVHPVVKDQVPTKVNVIIDGQQRCTTLLVWACALCDLIAKEVTSIQPRAEEPGWSECVEISGRTLKRLALMIHDDERGADEAYRYYPRLIRSHDDQWSKRKTQAVYVSPIGRLLRHASEWIRMGSRGRLSYSIAEFVDAERARHEPIQKALRFFLNQGDAFAKGDEFESIAPPTAAQMAENSEFQELLWGNEWTETVRKTVVSAGQSDDRPSRALIRMIRLTALANFMMSRICFTVVRSDREGCAFDMFDALNTTGQPLSAFETFRPLVIREVGLEAYRQSEEYKHLERISGFLAESGDKKGKVTEKLIVHLRVFECGQKLSKRLAVQRQWLKSYYLNELRGSEDRLELLRHLSDLAKFSEVFAQPEQHRQLAGDGLTELALAHLSEVKHDVVVPILTCFYSNLSVARSDEGRQDALEQIRLAVRGTLAFSVLWRLAKGGTEKIDDCFRLIMRGHVLREGGPSVGPFCARPAASVGPRRNLRAAEYLADLRAWLADAQLGTEDKWVSATANRESYAEAPQYARILLAAAMHDSIPDPSAAGLLKAGNTGTCVMLANDSTWRVDRYDIEHIAPRNGVGRGWSESIYQAGNSVNCLGNLTLLPAPVNRAIKDWPWSKKRAVMELLATADPSTATSLRDRLVELGTLPEFPTLDKIVGEARYHSHLRSIAGVADWSAQAIAQRSENICRLGYRQLSALLQC